MGRPEDATGQGLGAAVIPSLNLSASDLIFVYSRDTFSHSDF